MFTTCGFLIKAVMPRKVKKMAIVQQASKTTSDQ